MGVFGGVPRRRSRQKRKARPPATSIKRGAPIATAMRIPRAGVDCVATPPILFVSRRSVPGLNAKPVFVYGKVAIEQQLRVGLLQQKFVDAVPGWSHGTRAVDEA